MTSRDLVRFGRLLALSGYCGLLALMILWHGWLAPAAILPPLLVLSLVLAPLLCALRGMVRGTRYTHAWISLLAPLYLVLGIDGMAAGIEPRWLAPATVTAASALFTGAVVYIRAQRSATGTQATVSRE